MSKINLDDFVGDLQEKKVVYKVSNRSPFIAVVANFLLGPWGGHSFYAGRIKSGIIRLILGFLGVLLPLLDIKFGFIFYLLTFTLGILDYIRISEGRYLDVDNKVIRPTSGFFALLNLIALVYFIFFGIISSAILLSDPKSVSNDNQQASSLPTKFQQAEPQRERLFYDEHHYETVNIGNQVWMAENLRTKKGKWTCYDKNPENCDIYGLLYDWQTANEACPDGWRLPTMMDWDELFDHVGGKDNAGAALKAKDHWAVRDDLFGAGKNTVGFSALPAGALNDRFQFVNGGYSTFFWSSTETKFQMVNIVGFNYENKMVSVGESAKYYSYSVRCLKDKNPAVGNEEPQKNSEGEKENGNKETKKYKTVEIGSQTWMAENINWKTSKSKCYKGQNSNCQKYGRLYNWEEALVACPRGWRLPSYSDWQMLIDFVGGKSVAGKLLKSTKGWKEGGNGKDGYGFSALPSGLYDNEYRYMGYGTQFWTSTDVSSRDVIVPNLGARYNDVNYMAGNKYDYYPVRCIADD